MEDVPALRNTPPDSRRIFSQEQRNRQIKAGATRLKSAMQVGEL